MSKYYVFGANHGKEASNPNNKHVYSDEPLPKEKPKNGELYFGYLAKNNGPFIGEVEDNYLYDGYRKIRHHDYVMPVDIAKINLYILSSDGKQKHADLVDNNIGEIFPISSIGKHNKYKYQIEIDGELVSLSRDNVIFIHEDYDKKPKLNTQSYYSYYGIIGRIGRRLYDYMGLFKYVKFFPLNTTTVSLHVPICYLKETNEYVRVGLTNHQYSEVVDNKIDIMKSNEELSVSNTLMTNGIFGFPFVIKNNKTTAYLLSYIVDKENFEKIKDLFKDRYEFYNNAFLLKKEFYKICNVGNKRKLNKGRLNNRRRGGRNRFAVRDFDINEELARLRNE